MNNSFFNTTTKIGAKDIPSQSSIDLSSSLIMINNSTSTPISRVRLDKVKWGIENMSFKPVIDQMSADITQLEEDLENFTPQAIQYNYIKNINDSAVAFFGDINDGEYIPLNVTHINSLVEQSPDVSITDRCGNTLNTGIREDYTITLDAGLYEAEFSVEIKSVDESIDILADLFCKTGVGTSPNGFVLITGNRRRATPSFGVQNMRGKGYFFLCQQSNIALRMRSTGAFILGDYSSDGELGVTSTALSQLSNIIESPAFLHIKRVGDSNTLSPTLGIA